MASNRPKGVQLEAGSTASALLARILAEATDRFGLEDVEIPTDTKLFKRRYHEALVRFEAARATSTHRSEVARFLANRSQQQLLWSDGDGGERPIAEHLAARVDPLAVTRTAARGDRGLTPEIAWEGDILRGESFRELLRRLRERSWMTAPAAAALRWVIDHAEDTSGVIDLSGHKFVLMGAAAELAPTRLLLQAGAEILWVDIHSPEEILGPLRDLGGALVHAPAGADLLTQPAEILATIREFADGDPVHLGMFAYRAGRGREWRLEGVMNAIGRALEPQLVRSVAMYVSPTSAHVVQPEDVAAAQRRRTPIWHRVLQRSGALPPNHHRHGELAIARAIVPLQGASYQAAQYISKLMAAEAFATPSDDRSAPRVSANVAGITNTVSMTEPVFQAAFAGAPLFGVHIFDPAATRAFAAQLLLHDLLDPQAANRAPAALFTQQVHGGVFAMPDALSAAITIAAAIGLGRKPGLVRHMWRRGS